MADDRNAVLPPPPLAVVVVPRPERGEWREDIRRRENDGDCVVAAAPIRRREANMRSPITSIDGGGAKSIADDGSLHATRNSPRVP